jgi:hypothetical protein
MGGHRVPLTGTSLVRSASLEECIETESEVISKRVRMISEVHRLKLIDILLVMLPASSTEIREDIDAGDM